MRKLMTGIAVFALILMQVQGVFGLTSSSTVNAREEQVVLDNDLARVSVTSEVVEDTIEWTLHYNKRAPDDAIQRAIRVRLAQAADGTGTVQRKDGDLNQSPDDGWFHEAEFSSKSEGTLTVTTPTTAEQLVVWTQVDSQLMGEITTDLLKDSDAEGKVIAAPEIPVVETTPETDVAEQKPDAGNTGSDDNKEADIVVDDTPVDVSKPELTEEAAPAAEAEEQAKDAEATEARLAYAAPYQITWAGSTSNEDQFTYVIDELGTYPRDFTNAHITVSGQQSNDNIRNYGYDKPSNSTADTTVQSILNSGTAFEKGYSRYTEGTGIDQYNVYSKKSVMPTSNENEYQVQLDLIGDAIERLPDMDVVLVIDKSLSMREMDGEKLHRWGRLQNAVRNFSTQLLAQGDGIQIGMSTFGGTSGSVGVTRPFAEICSFSAIQGTLTNPTFTGYTKSANTLMSHRTFSADAYPGGGTPTFLGVDAGLNLLMNTRLGARDNVAKILIVVSDGEPTYSPSTGRNSYLHDGNENLRSVTGSLNQGTISVEGTLANPETRLRYLFGSSNYYNGDGSGDDLATLESETIDYAKIRYAMPAYAQVQKYSIGFHTGTIAKDVLKELGTSGSYQADSGDELNAALEKILQVQTYKVINGILTDPLGDAVTRIGGVTLAALTLQNGVLSVIASNSSRYPQYAKDIEQVVTADQIVLKNVNLGAENGAQQGIRVTYTVQLKEAYRDGKFYQTNKKTELANFGDKYIHFAIPSIKWPQVTGDITVEKVWDDNDNAWNTRQDITLELQNRKVGTSRWTKVDSYLLAKDAETLTHTFKNVPTKDGLVALEYQVIERYTSSSSRVPGYSNPVYSPTTTQVGKNETLTVTNTLKSINYEFTKQTSTGKLLDGAEFTVTRAGSTKSLTVTSVNGKVAISNLPIGVYTVKETKAPDGFAGAVQFTLTVTDNGASRLSITSSLTNNVAINKLKDSELTLIKKDAVTQTELSGATFDIWQVKADGQNEYINTQTTGSNGELRFPDLPAGTYRVTETVAPTGFALLAGDFIFTITADGQVTNFSYTATDVDNDQSPTLELTSSEHKYNQLQITANNLPQAPPALPRTGGMGTQIILIIGLLVVGTAGFWKLTDWRKHRGGDEDA